MNIAMDKYTQKYCTDMGKSKHWWRHIGKSNRLKGTHLYIKKKEKTSENEQERERGREKEKACLTRQYKKKSFKIQMKSVLKTSNKTEFVWDR